MLATLTVFAMACAHAQAYLGANVGSGHVNLDCTGTTSCSDNDTGFKLLGGCKFAPNFAAEVSYIDFGKAKASDLGTQVELGSTALVLAIAARGDFTPTIAGVARLGLANVDTTGRVIGLGSTSESKAAAYFGLSLEYAFTKNFKAVVDADFTTGEISGESGAVRLLSIGAQYSF